MKAIVYFILLLLLTGPVRGGNGGMWPSSPWFGQQMQTQTNADGILNVLGITPDMFGSNSLANAVTNVQTTGGAPGISNHVLLLPTNIVVFVTNAIGYLYASNNYLFQGTNAAGFAGGSGLITDVSSNFTVVAGVLDLSTNLPSATNAVGGFTGSGSAVVTQVGTNAYGMPIFNVDVTGGTGSATNLTVVATNNPAVTNLFLHGYATLDNTNYWPVYTNLVVSGGGGGGGGGSTNFGFVGLYTGTHDTGSVLMTNTAGNTLIVVAVNAYPGNTAGAGESYYDTNGNTYALSASFNTAYETYKVSFATNIVGGVNLFVPTNNGAGGNWSYNVLELQGCPKGITGFIATNNVASPEMIDSTLAATGNFLIFNGSYNCFSSTVTIGSYGVTNINGNFHLSTNDFAAGTYTTTSTYTACDQAWLSVIQLLK